MTFLFITGRPVRYPLWLPLGLALAANLLLWLESPPLIVTVAALLLAGWLPGLLLVDLLVGRSAAPPAPAELLLYSSGAGYGVIVVVLLLLSYLPGGLARSSVWAAFNSVVLAGILLLWWRDRNPPGEAFLVPLSADSSVGQDAVPTRASRPLVLTGVLVLLLVGGYLRLANLGYAEFHGDEARGALRAAAVIQGYEDVLLLHKKGPTEILLPALLFSLTGQLDETIARLPLAIANLATLLAVWWLGWRLLQPLAGWLAAFLLTFDGYLIAFARFLQYQSVVLLTGVLVVIVLVRIWQQPRAVARYLTLAALLWATGLLSHYDALSIGVPVLFLLGLILWQRRMGWRDLLRAALPAVLVGGGLLALFYAPYVLHPNFGSTVSYLVEQRFVVGQRFPYNGLHDLTRRSLVYNSGYYGLFQLILTGVAILLAYRRAFGRNRGTLLGLALLAVLGWTLWQPTWLRAAGLDFAVIPFALTLLPLWVAPRLRNEERLLWVWFGLLFLVTFFGMALPRTHIYVFFVPWALLMAAPLAAGWESFRQRCGERTAVAAGAVALASMTLFFGFYDYWYYVHTGVEVLRTWPANNPRGYWTPAFTKEVDSLYGFPLNNGWKVVGALYAEGVLQGDFETNQRYLWVPHWYTLGEHRCGSTATWYFAIDNLESWSLRSADAEDMLEEQGYVRWGQVTVQGAPRLVIYRQADGSPRQERTFAFEEYAPRFDAAVRATMPLVSPIVEPPISQPLRLNFGNEIELAGYQIEGNRGLKPGDSFRLTLFWRAQRGGLPSYKVSNQAFYGDGVMVAQKDAMPACDREPTNLWSPGDLVVDVHDIPVALNAPPGLYPLYTALYGVETGVRLPVLDEAGNPVADHVHLADVEIVDR